MRKAQSSHSKLNNIRGNKHQKQCLKETLMFKSKKELSMSTDTMMEAKEEVEVEEEAAVASEDMEKKDHMIVREEEVIEVATEAPIEEEEEEDMEMLQDTDPRLKVAKVAKVNMLNLEIQNN
jgi:hypothetical protein